MPLEAETVDGCAYMVGQKNGLFDRAVFHEYRKLITIDGVRVVFPYGWGLARASNTQPALVLRFEADSEEHLKEIQEYVEGELRSLGL